MGRRKHLAPDIAGKHCVEFSVEELTFVTELVKHGNVSRASTAAGWHPNTGYQKRDDERIKWLENEARKQAFERAVIDVQWVMDEAEDLYFMAKREGDIKAGISALNLIGKLSPVDAFAAQKIDLGLEDKISRLKQGRLRAAQATAVDVAEDAEIIEEVSFL